MTKESYERTEAWFLARPSALKVLQLLNRILPGVVYCAYSLLLVLLLLKHDPKVMKVLLVPAFAFALVTVLRRIINLPRPYESLGIRPLIPREKNGESFPSRHAASASVIAVAFCFAFPTLGALMWVIAVMIGIVRVLAGIHFVRDVAGGIFLGAAIGFFGFWLL
jgi:PAP2 superfamily.